MYQPHIPLPRSGCLWLGEFYKHLVARGPLGGAPSACQQEALTNRNQIEGVCGNVDRQRALLRTDATRTRANHRGNRELT